jgi:pyruvate/2-oxoglutarate dehydrogenase complex dihydrolipoamide acyltransferase (E2) component
LDQARAALKGKNRLVSNCNVRAPFSGIVVERIASVGDYVTVGTPLIRLVDTIHIEVAAQVQEQDIPSLKESTDLDFIDRYAQFPLQLRTVLPVMESRLRSFETRLAFKDERASSGTTGRLRWKSPWPHLPSEYLVKREDSLGIFVLSDDTARFQPLSEARQGQPARLSLPADTVMVLEGRHSLRDGDPVNVIQSGGQ